MGPENEICDLIEETDVITDEEGNQIPFDNLVHDDDKTFVVFEDAEGIFGLNPEQIINVEVIGDADAE